MTRRLKILLLAGTREAREIAKGLSGHRVTASLAGVTSNPKKLAVPVRKGGFGGPDGLTSHLKSQRYDMVIDATHPFAEVISKNAAAAGRATETPVLHVLRPGWTAPTGINWQCVPSLHAAAAALPKDARVFLTTGSKDLACFSNRNDVWFLARVINQSKEDPFERGRIIMGRPPFSVEHETEVMRSAKISHLVARDSGGVDGTAKLVAAARLAIKVVLIDRPPPPAGAIVTSVADALARVELLAGELQ